MTSDRPHPDLDAPLTAAEADEMRRVRTLDLDEIEQRYTPKDPGPCRVCGEPLSISSFGPAGVTWACNYLSDEQEADGRCKIKPGRGGREETRPGGHYSESRVIQYGRTDSEVTALVAEVRRLRAALREAESLLDCTEFALEWLILHHVIEDGGKDWRSKFDGSAFFACDCSENGGYMEWDTNAYIHTERCASGFEDSLPALYDQIKALRPRARAALTGTDSGEAR